MTKHITPKPRYNQLIKHLKAYYAMQDFLVSLEPKPKLHMLFHGELGAGKTISAKLLGDDIYRAFSNIKLWEPPAGTPPRPKCPVRLPFCGLGYEDYLEHLHPIEKLAFRMWQEKVAKWDKKYGLGHGQLVGVGAMRIKCLFEQARAVVGKEPSIIVFDELDSLLQQRNNSK